MAALQNDLAYPADIVTTPEKAVANYLISRKLKSELVKRPPDWDVAGDSPDIHLIAAKRDLTEAKRVLSSEKAIYDAKSKEIDKRWEELRLKQCELRDAFIKDNKVIKSNYKERKKSEKLIAEEESEQQRIQLDINDLEKDLHHYQVTEAQLIEKVSELKIYEEFLQKVVDEYPEFSCIDDILSRYESLVETREEMRELQIKSLSHVENIRKEIEELTEEGMQVIYTLNRNLYKLRMTKYLVQKELTHWVQAIEKFQDMAHKDYNEITKAVDGIWLLYLNVCRARKQKPQLSQSCLQEQLKYIIENLNILNGVLNESKKYYKNSELYNESHPIPSERDLDKWSADYEMFQSVRTDRAQGSEKK